MKKLWDKYNTLLGITCILIGLGIAVAPVLAYGPRISGTETSISGIKENMANVNGKLDVLLVYFGLHYMPVSKEPMP